MKHYISPAGALHAYESDGSQDEFIPADFIPATDEQMLSIQNPDLTPEQVKQSAIYALESTITPRRMREAMLGMDSGWLSDVDAQIAALRV